jgi:hypothetical protein
MAGWAQAGCAQIPFSSKQSTTAHSSALKAFRDPVPAVTVHPLRALFRLRNILPKAVNISSTCFEFQQKVESDSNF